MDLAADLELALALADEADAISMRSFRAGSIPTTVKPDGSRVSAVDLEIDRVIVERLDRERPGDGLFTEESGRIREGHRQWVIDPLDGTHGYLDGTTAWGHLIALEVDGVPVLGVVSMPARSQRWSGAVGLGATRTDRDGTTDLHVADGMRAGVPRWTSMPTDDELTDTDRRIVQPLAAWGDPLPFEQWTTYPSLMVVEGLIDCAVEFGARWDHAAHGGIVAAAGGHYALPPGAPDAYHASLTASPAAFASALDLLGWPASAS